MRHLAYALAAAVLLAPAAPLMAADLASEPFLCVDEAIGRDFLSIEHTDVKLISEGAGVRTYAAKISGKAIKIEMDACTSQVLSEARE